MSTRITELRQTLIYNDRDKNYDDACQDAILLAEALIREKPTKAEAKEAMFTFTKAKKYIAKSSPGITAERKQELKFKAYRGFLEAVCYAGAQPEIRLAVKEFAARYDRNSVPIKLQQDALFFISYVYTNHVTKSSVIFELAFKYAAKSLELLESFEVKDDEDYELRKISILHVLASKYLEQDKLEEARQTCENGLACKSIANAPALHLVFWDIKRKSLLSRMDRLECSKAMLKIYEAGLKSNKKEKCDVYICLGEDYITHNDFANAEKCFCEVYFDPECRKFDKKKHAESDLINLYKVNKNLERVQAMELNDTADPITMAKMYEKIADFATEKLWAHEFAIEYYNKSLQIAMNLHESFEGEKFNLINDCYTSLAETASDIHDYQKAVEYYNELLQIAEDSNVSEEILTDIKLNRAIKTIDCDFPTLEMRETALLAVFPLLTKSIHLEHYYENYAKLLDMYKKKKTCTKQLIGDLRKKHKEYSKAVEENEYAPEVSRSIIVEDELDVMSAKEVLALVEEKWKSEKEIETLKKHIAHRNDAGESELHHAVKKRENGLAFAKLLIEKCGYGMIIDEQDSLGMTPLFYALMFEKFDIAQYYIQQGADVNISTTESFECEDGSTIPSGHTPLMLASSYGNKEMIALLVANGAILLEKDEEGNTAADYVAKYRRDSGVTGSESAESSALGILEEAINQSNDKSNLQIASTSNSGESVIKEENGNIGSGGGDKEEANDTVDDSGIKNSPDGRAGSVDIFDNGSSSEDDYGGDSDGRKRSYPNSLYCSDEEASYKKSRIKSPSSSSSNDDDNNIDASGADSDDDDVN